MSPPGLRFSGVLLKIQNNITLMRISVRPDEVLLEQAENQ